MIDVTLTQTLVYKNGERVTFEVDIDLVKLLNGGPGKRARANKKGIGKALEGGVVARIVCRVPS
jgi:hypothetical protein